MDEVYVVIGYDEEAASVLAAFTDEVKAQRTAQASEKYCAETPRPETASLLGLDGLAAWEKQEDAWNEGHPLRPFVAENVVTILGMYDKFAVKALKVF